MIGIYKIVNLINNKCYIGKTNSIKRRKNDHFNSLRKNKHDNAHLQASWNKYKEENFKFYIIEEFSEFTDELLNEREKYWIKYYKSNDNKFGFNNTDGGEGTTGYKHTIFAKAKISKASKNRKLTLEHKQKLLKANTGRIKSPEELEKLSKAAKGRKISEWHKQQLINSTKGKPFTDEHKKNLSIACKGRIISDKQKQDISNTLKGNKNAQKLSLEQKEEIKKIFLQNNNISILEIAKNYNVSTSTIYGIKSSIKKISNEHK